MLQLPKILLFHIFLFLFLVRSQKLGNGPESVARKLSMITKSESKGAMLATYLTTSLSLLKAYPRTKRQQKRIVLVEMPSIAARIIDVITAALAAFGFPAPSSFETRVLQNSV